MSKNDLGKQYNKTTWIVTGLAIILVAIATDMNHGPSNHLVGSATDRSARVQASNSD